MSDDGGSYVGRVVAFLRAAEPARAVANALLDLGLPRIRAWLREKAGPNADVGEIRLEKDRALVHLDRVRVPLGARGLLALDHASATIVRGRKSGLPEARLQAFNGVLSFGEGDESFRAEISFLAAEGADVDAWIAGELLISRASWTARSGATARGMTGKAKLFVSPSEWRLEEGILEAMRAPGEDTTNRARVRFAGHGALDGTTPLALARLDLDTAYVGPFADALTAIGGQALTVPAFVPHDALLRGDVVWDAREGGRCALTIRSESIDATIHGRVAADGAGLEGRIEADIRPAIPLRAANIAPKAVPRDEDRLRIEVRVEGRVDHPIAHGTIRAKEIGFRMGRPRFVPCPVVRAIDGIVDVDGRTARARLTAKAGQGTVVVDAEGDLREPSDLRANLTLADLDGAFVREVLVALGVPVVVPRDLRASAKLRGEGSAIAGSLSLVTARSSVTIDPLRLEGNDPTGTRVAARLALADVLEAGLASVDVRPHDSGVLEIDLEGAVANGRPIFSGALRLTTLAIEIGSRPDVPAFAFQAIDGRVDVGLDSVRLYDLRFEAYEGRWRAEATIPLRPSSGERAGRLTYAAWVEGASASLLEQLGFFVHPRNGNVSAPAKVRVAREGEHRPPDEIWIANDTRLVGEIRGAESRPIVVDLALETGAGTALVFHGQLGSGAAEADGGVGGRTPPNTVDGSTLRGNVALADILLTGVFDEAELRPTADGTVRIDSKLKGPTGAIVLLGYIAAPAIRLTIEESKAEPILVTDVSSLFRVDQDKLVWHRCLARLYGGAVTSAGAVGYGDAFAGVHATVAMEGVAIEDVPIEEGTLAPFVRGALSATLRFDRRGGGGEVIGTGNARLDHGAFPALAQGAQALSKYGLAPPREEAIAPATMTIDLDERGWTLSNIRAWVRGASVSGEVRVATNGHLLGYMTVFLEEEFLRSSAILVLPRVLADRLTLPVRLKGTIDAPVIDADLAACFNKFVTENKVSSFFISAVEEAAVLLGAQPAAEPTPPPETPPPPDPMDDDALLRELIVQGAEWDEIEQRLDEHRRAQVRYRVG